jgi:Leishmanolysin
LSYGATGKSCNYFPGTASVASPDNTLTVGRPTVGRIKFNTYNLVDRSTLTNLLFQSVTATALHETMHILGFDSTLYSTFLDPTLGYTYSTPQIFNSSAVNAQRPRTSLLTTPYVTAWAKSFFNCSTLQGMLLENQDGTGLGAGSHW